MRLNITNIVAVSLCVLGVTFAKGDAPAPDNLVMDGGFEQGGAGWQLFAANGANATGEIDRAEKHEGKCSYKITNKTGFAPNVYARITQNVAGLKPYTIYKVSCWAKGKGCGIAWIGGGPGWYTRNAFPKGDFEWQQVSFEVDAGSAADNYDLMVVTESQTEALWVDDVRFEPARVDQAKRDAVYAELNGKIANLRGRLDALQQQWKTKALNPYDRLAMAVAQRFIDFAGKGGPDGRTSLVWSAMQLDEVAQVLDEAEKLARNDGSFLDWKQPNPGSVKLKKGIFYNGSKPYYFAGYGHFDAVIEDLVNFPTFGASLIQDGRAGPSSMNADGALQEGAVQVLQGMDRASHFGMREDFLLSPHYYPDWANAPDLRNGNIGFIGFNIFHPTAKAAIEKWTAVMADRIKDKPALHSVCLANEPVYNTSGRDKYSKPAFAAYLKEKHKDISELNALYGTGYKSFDEVPVPPDAMPAAAPARRAYYDWTCFNKKMFADWHGGLSSIMKNHGVKAPTHTKIMVFQTLDRDKLGWGVDPELICRATDLAGCDAYAFPGGAYAYDWFGHEFFYDLLHSFRGQSVFNSENHLIPDGSGPGHIPMGHTRSVLWQGGLHHQGSTTIWVWEKASDPSLVGSIYFRPANIYGAGRAMLDLNRLAKEVTAINTQEPRVALLYSQPSIFWQEKYQGTIYALYTALNFMGENVTFVSERQLAEGAAAKVKWIIAPNATHVLGSTPAALSAFKKSGGNVLLVGKECLGRDEYDRPLGQADYPVLEWGGNGHANSAGLRRALGSLPLNELRDAKTGEPTWGIEFRVAREGRATLVPLINFNKESRSVRLPRWAAQQAVDLLSGEKVNLDAVALEPMTPRLLRISR